MLIYHGRYHASQRQEDDEALGDWDVLPLDLYPQLDACEELVILDPLSFPFDSLRSGDRSIRVSLHLPDVLSVDEVVLLFGDVALRHLSFYDRLVVIDDVVWEALRGRYMLADSQRIVPQRSGVDAALSAVVAHLEQTRVERVVTPLGSFYTPENDLITRQLVEYGGHQRGDLSMLLSIVDAGNVVLDVGAHIGTFSIPLARAVDEGGHVFAFEPAQLPFDLLERNIGDNGLASRISLFRSIVSDRPGRFRAVRDPSNTGATAFQFVDEGSADDIDVMTVDAWWDESGRIRVDILKIDVEGMELSVLRGALALLRAHRPIIFVELSEIHLASVGASMMDVDRLLREHGYDFFVNVGPRNVSDDRYEVKQVPGLSPYRNRLFDLLAVHRDHPTHGELVAPDAVEVGQVQ